MNQISKEDFDKIIDVISAVAHGNYNAQVELIGDNGYYDAICTGINMMIDDIRVGVNKIEREADFTKNIINHISEMLIVTNADGKIILVNPACLKLLRYSEEYLIGKSIEALFGSEYSIHAKKYPALDIESSFLTKEGKKIPVLLSISTKKKSEGEEEEFIYVAKDITERIKKQREMQIYLHNMEKVNEELRKSKQVAEESMMTKEKFLANMSHEIRTPMNAIIGFTSLLLSSAPTKEQKEFIEAIKYSGDNLLVIINDILDFSKMQSGKLIFEETDFSIRNIANALALTFQPAGNEKNIGILLEIASNVPEMLKGDPVRLNQILTNLLSNAVKFTEKGFVKLSVKNLAGDDTRSLLEFIVEDSGIGIPEEKLIVIFDSFTQVSTRKYGGTGLGLSITKSIVEQTGGTISVESKFGSGTKFIVRLPFKKGNLNSGDNPAWQDEFQNYNFKGVKVLVVDDNRLNQLLAKNILEKVGCEVELAEDGIFALKKISEKNIYDLILMDIEMPQMNGYETTKVIRTMEGKISQVPIIAITAHAMGVEEDKCKNAGMNDYISKPYKPLELCKVIKKLSLSSNGISA